MEFRSIRREGGDASYMMLLAFNLAALTVVKNLTSLIKEMLSLEGRSTEQVN